ncbi:MAG: CPBP family intramembrane metalloprotease [Treponema sp.]|nr:CPBP family intramembrane metalloprotease [Treponema sp.]
MIETVFFIVIFSLFIMPPILTKDAATALFTSWTFPLVPLLHALLALFVYRFLCGRRVLSAKARGHASLIIKLLYALGAFCCLCVTAALITRTIRLLGSAQRFTVALPSSAREAAYCIINFACASFYEEVLYRRYMPETMQMILERMYSTAHGRRTTALISEAASVLLFALAHRYLGIASVCNALVAGIVLRIACKKSGTIWVNFVAHFAYNIVSLTLFAVR